MNFLASPNRPLTDCLFSSQLFRAQYFFVVSVYFTCTLGMENTHSNSGFCGCVSAFSHIYQHKYVNFPNQPDTTIEKVECWDDMIWQSDCLNDISCGRFVTTFLGSPWFCLRAVVTGGVGARSLINGAFPKVSWLKLLNHTADRGGELLNIRALIFSVVNKIHIFQCMGKIFCVEFQRVPLKFHTKYLTHTLKDMIFIQH